MDREKRSTRLRWAMLRLPLSRSSFARGRTTNEMSAFVFCFFHAPTPFQPTLALLVAMMSSRLMPRRASKLSGAEGAAMFPGRRRRKKKKEGGETTKEREREKEEETGSSAEKRKVEIIFDSP